MTLDALTFPQTFCLDFLRVKSVPYRRNVSDLISGSKPQTRHLCVSWFSQVLLSFPNRPGLRSQLQSAEYDNISTGATQFGLVLLSLSLSFFSPPLSLSLCGVRERFTLSCFNPARFGHISSLDRMAAACLWCRRYYFSLQSHIISPGLYPSRWGCDSVMMARLVRKQWTTHVKTFIRILLTVHQYQNIWFVATQFLCCCRV